MKQTRSQNYLWAALLLALLLGLAAQLPVLANPFAVEEDFRTLFWMNRFQDPELFSRVPLEKFGVRTIELGPIHLDIESSSPGYSLIFYAASFIVSPLTFSKWLAFPLLLTAVYFIYRIGEQLADPKSALILSLLYTTLNLASDTEISVIAGLHRSFATPFLLALMFFLLNRRYRAAALVLFLSGIIYLPIFPVSALTYLLSVIRFRGNGRWRLTVQWKPVIYLTLAALIVIMAVSPILLRNLSRAAETSSSAQPSIHILNDPEYKMGGRRPLFNLFPFVGRGGFASHRIGALNILFLSLAAVILGLIRRRQMAWLPRPFGNMLIASLISFALAWGSILITSTFMFYIPSRHTQSSFFLLTLILVGINLKGALPIIMQWITSHRRQLVWYAMPIILIALGLATFPPKALASQLGANMRILLIIFTTLLLLLSFIAARRSRGQEVNPTQTYTPSVAQWRMTLAFFLLFAPLFIFFMSAVRGNFLFLPEEERHLMAHIATLPKDSLIGGEPCRLDNVQLFANRTVLFSCEHYQFWKDPGIVQAMLAAYYAKENEQIIQFCEEYGVDYFVVDENRLTNEFITAGKFFFEPYNSWLNEKISGQTNFALADVAEENSLFRVGSTFVMPCRTIK
ncbi:MAG: hypothetical protein GY803_19175 [Chloroflexi bacterium]|nr:hypothetical protein [Chloroflexota bacterium]